jgi:hypothetical protein
VILEGLVKPQLEAPSQVSLAYKIPQQRPKTQLLSQQAGILAKPLQDAKDGVPRNLLAE